MLYIGVHLNVEFKRLPPREDSRMESLVMYTQNVYTLEVEARGSGVQNHSQLHGTLSQKK